MNSSRSRLSKAPSGTKPAGVRLEPTRHLILGPIYPIHVPSHWNSALCSGGRESPCEPSRVRVSGRVLDTSGRPIVDALVEVWQADQDGRYRHPDAQATQPADPRFVGYAAQRTAAFGRYCFWT